MSITMKEKNPKGKLKSNRHIVSKINSLMKKRYHSANTFRVFYQVLSPLHGNIYRSNIIFNAMMTAEEGGRGCVCYRTVYRYFTLNSYSLLQF